jgi:RimJ/RimL family protein N-acetyltransferase
MRPGRPAGSRTLVIRPVLESDLDLLALLSTDPEEASQYGFFGYQDPGRQRRQFAENGFLSEHGGRLAVALVAGSEPGEFIGDVSWHRSPSGPTSYCWNIGIALLARARGQGYGASAQRLLAEYLLGHTQVNRVEAETEVDNGPERRALEKAGFAFEGVRRGSCYRAGRWRDMALYSVVRADLDLT